MDRCSLAKEFRRALAFAALAALAPAPSYAQLLFTGNGSTLKSSGIAAGSGWTLNTNGYLGNFFYLAEPADVTIDVRASGVAAGDVAPRMNLVVGDASVGFDVALGLNAYEHTFSLRSGYHFVRTELANDGAQTARSLTIADMSLDHGQSVRTGDGTALLLANSNIENYRKGDAALSLVGVAPGADVHVRLKQHEFKFGTAVGTNNQFVSPTPNQTGQNYQQFVRDHFNMVVPGNSGKWSNTEFIRDVNSLNGMNNMIAFAKREGIAFRQHNMIWGNDGGSPGWVNTLLTSAATNPAAKQELLEEIYERIAYYIGDGVGTDPVSDYISVDVLNEGVHEGEYLSVYGYAGLADIFNRVAAARDAAGSQAKLYVNEYNVLQNGSDAYGNWFRQHAEGIEAAGGVVDGFGVQYYANATTTGANAHSPQRILGVFENLANGGKEFTLSEFGVSSSGTPTDAQVAKVMEDTMRLVFGSPAAAGFNIWGFWANDIWQQAPRAALVDASWNLTPIGVRYEALMDEWNTDLTLPVGETGSVDFRGFYGEYDVIVDGRVYSLDLTKGTTDYQLIVNLPADFNDDGTVDAEDLEAWMASVEAGDDGGDANGDGLTDGADLLAWQSMVGMSLSPSIPAPAPLAAIPEPAGSALVAITVGQLLMTMKRRGRNGGATRSKRPRR